MEIRGNQNQQSSDDVEQEPGDGEPRDQAKGPGYSASELASRWRRCNVSLKTTRAEEFSFVLGNAFSAKIAGTSRAPDNRFAVTMDAASLENEVHFQLRNIGLGFS
jgi:hypothetical protein